MATVIHTKWNEWAVKSLALCAPTNPHLLKAKKMEK